MPEAEELPPAFDPEREKDKFLAAAKKRGAARFSRKKAASLENAARLAYWLFVYGRDAESLGVCRFVGETQFAGNFSLWTWVAPSLALQSRLARRRGLREEVEGCVERIRAAGVVPARLEGSLLDDKLENSDRREAEKDKTGEREWRLIAMMELCLLAELGGSAKWPVAALEEQTQKCLARLRAIQKVA